MDPDSVKSTLSNLAFGNVLAAAARDYQKVIFRTIPFPTLSFPTLETIQGIAMMRGWSFTLHARFTVWLICVQLATTAISFPYGHS